MGHMMPTCEVCGGFQYRDGDGETVCANCGRRRFQDISTLPKVHDVATHKYTIIDDGCQLSRSCLTCTMPECILDSGSAAKTLVLLNTRTRDYQADFIRQHHMSYKEAAEYFDISERTVQRLMAKR